MQTYDEESATVTLAAGMMSDVCAAADRAGMAPDDLIRLAIRLRLAELADRAELSDAEPGAGTRGEFFDWSR